MQRSMTTFVRADSGTAVPLCLDQGWRSTVPYHSRAPQRFLGRYEIIYPIAAGGMASVYAGRLSGMAGFERLFAVKVIHPHLAAEQAFIEMFLDEARLVGRIQHPHVAEIYEVGEQEGLYYMVGELVLGPDLRTLGETARARGVHIPPPLLAGTIAEVAAGLHEAHELRDEDGEPSHLVHRDVSTRNILISYKGYAKLIDFGVAWARGRLSHTQDGHQKGKIGYMPPEQLRGAPLDRRADIFALGVVLYTMAAGSHPFPYENEGEQVAKMLAGAFDRPRAVNPTIDPALEAIILTAMALDPANRFSTAQEMGRALAAYAESRTHGDPHKQLSRTMEALFADRIAEHNEKLRAHRKQASQTPAAPPPVIPRTDKETSPSRITAVITSDDEPGSGADALPGRLRQLRRLGARVLLSASLLALGGLAYVAAPPPSGPSLPDEGASHGERSASAARATADRPPARPEARVEIGLEGVPPGASVYLDGDAVSPPIRLPRSSIRRSLRVETPGFEDATTTFVPSQSQTVTIRQRPLARDHARAAPKPPRPSPRHRLRGVEPEAPLERPPEPTAPKPVALEGWEENPFL